MTCLWSKTRDENLHSYSYPTDSVFRSAFTYNTEREFSNSYAILNQSPDIDDDRDKTHSRLEPLTVAEIIVVGLSFLLVICTMPFSLFFSLKFVNSFERLVVMRLGKAKSIRGPGTVFILPCIDNATRVDIRVNSYVLPAVNIVTRDKGLVEFAAAVFSKIIDPLSSICAVQNKEQALQNLAYATLYKKLSKRTLADITSPTSLSQILAKVQEELNKFSMPLGIEITEVTVTQIRVLKQNENQAISLFNSLIKSDLGTKIMGTLESHLKEALVNGPTNGTHHLLQSMMPSQPSTDLIKEHSTLQSGIRDPDIDHLLYQLRNCCNESLVARIGKRFLIRCEDATGGPAELMIDLKNGIGHFEWINTGMNLEFDVEITLRKETLFALINGSISPLSAYINGSVVIKGSVADVTSLKILAERAKEFKIAQ